MGDLDGGGRDRVEKGVIGRCGVSGQRGNGEGYIDRVH